MEIDEDYVGREHALIKHRLLESYLETVLSIIGVTGRERTITYVDCFAGPWGSKSDDLQGTSIAISLEIIASVRASLSRHTQSTGIRFQAVYVEENPGRFKRLERYLAGNTPSGIESWALHGDYFARQPDILKLCGDGFAFFFIDPKGWKDVSAERLSRLLRRQHSEFLINFMYDFLNRALGMRAFRDEVEKVIGTLSSDESDTLEGLEPAERGEWIVRKYRRALEREMGGRAPHRPRSYHAEILNRSAERVHYHLVYLTRHAKGIVKFAEASEKADYLQRVVRLQTKMNASLQFDIFTAEQHADASQPGRVVWSEVRKLLLGAVAAGTPLTCDEAWLADCLQRTGWLKSDLEKGLLELINEGTIENVDAKRKRPIHPVNFAKGEKIRFAAGRFEHGVQGQDPIG